MDSIPEHKRFAPCTNRNHAGPSTPESSHGTGDVALEDCATAASAGDMAWYIYEHGQPDDPERALEEAAKQLPRLLDG